jgi:cold shock protein
LSLRQINYSAANLGKSPLTIEEDESGSILSGHVKWFDPAKGFGFVVAEGSPKDILLHANVLRNYGQSSVADGTPITLRVQQTTRGVQATEVIAIDAPKMTAVPLSEEGEMVTSEELAALPMEPARVKWFDKGKGFGFANVFGRPEDVFVHVEVLRASGFADLQPGEAVCLRIMDGRRGRMAVQVVSWDMAMRRGSPDGAQD